MSVPKGKRTEGKLQVLVELQALCAYTIQICKNEKNFPKRDRWILTQHIVKLAIEQKSWRLWLCTSRTRNHRQP